MIDIKRPFFKHYIFEFKCSFEEANSINWIENRIDSLLSLIGIKKLKTVYNQFEPQGISLVHILSASHIAIHTWPEDGYVQVDLISCQKELDVQAFTLAVDKVFEDFDHKITELNY